MKPKDFIKNSIEPFNTKKQVKFWFDYFNEAIFKNSLTYFSGVEISGKLDPELWGTLYFYEYEGDPPLREYTVAIQPTLPYKDFLGTLLHEMVHLYQGQIQKNFDFPEPVDDITFHIFQAKLKPYGITIL